MRFHRGATFPDGGQAVQVPDYRCSLVGAQLRRQQRTENARRPDRQARVANAHSTQEAMSGRDHLGICLRGTVPENLQASLGELPLAAGMRSAVPKARPYVEELVGLRSLAEGTGRDQAANRCRQLGSEGVFFVIAVKGQQGVPDLRPGSRREQIRPLEERRGDLFEAVCRRRLGKGLVEPAVDGAVRGQLVARGRRGSVVQHERRPALRAGSPHGGEQWRATPSIPILLRSRSERCRTMDRVACPADSRGFDPATTCVRRGFRRASWVCDERDCFQSPNERSAAPLPLSR